MTGCRVNVPVRVVVRVMRGHGEGQEDFTDGYSLETSEWRFNIRGSNTEPLLRLNIEARKEPLVDQIKKQIEEIINQ